MSDVTVQIQELVHEIEAKDHDIKIARAVKGKAMSQLNRLVAANPQAAEGIKLPGRKKAADEV